MGRGLILKNRKSKIKSQMFAWLYKVKPTHSLLRIYKVMFSYLPLGQFILVKKT